MTQANSPITEEEFRSTYVNSVEHDDFFNHFFSLDLRPDLDEDDVSIIVSNQAITSEFFANGMNNTLSNLVYATAANMRINNLVNELKATLNDINFGGDHEFITQDVEQFLNNHKANGSI